MSEHKLASDDLGFYDVEIFKNLGLKVYDSLHDKQYEEKLAKEKYIDFPPEEKSAIQKIKEYKKTVIKNEKLTHFDMTDLTLAMPPSVVAAIPRVKAPLYAFMESIAREAEFAQKHNDLKDLNKQDVFIGYKKSERFSFSLHY